MSNLPTLPVLAFADIAILNTRYCDKNIDSGEELMKYQYLLGPTEISSLEFSEQSAKEILLISKEKTLLLLNSE